MVNKYLTINLLINLSINEKKSQKVDISRPCGGATTPPIAMKLVVVKQLRTVITFAKFGVDRSIRFSFIGSRILAFYIHLANGRYNSFALPCSRLMNVNKFERIMLSSSLFTAPADKSDAF